MKDTYHEKSKKVNIDTFELIYVHIYKLNGISWRQKIIRHYYKSFI